MNYFSIFPKKNASKILIPPPKKKLKFDFFKQFVIININLKSGEEL